MEKYYYTKFVHATPLKEVIMLGVSKNLWRKIEQLNVKTFLQEEHLEDDNIEIATNEILTSSELDEVADAINSYNATHPLVIRHGIELNVMNPAVTFGNVLLQKFAANNLYLGKTAAQVQGLLAANSSLIITLQTGSLTTALAIFGAMQADGNISQGEIDEFRTRLEIYLGV